MENDVGGRSLLSVQVCFVIEVLEDLEYEVAQFEGVIFIEVYEGYFREKGGLIEEEDDLLNVFGGNGSLLNEGQWLVLHCV